MKLQIITTNEEFKLLQQQWDELHNEVRGTIFQTFYWNYTWWRLYGEKYELRIAAFWNGDVLVGILPLFRERINFIVFTLYRLKFLGTYEIYGEYHPLVHQAYENELIQDMAVFCNDELVQRRADLLEFYRFPPSSTIMKKLLQQLSSFSLETKFVPFSLPRAILELPASWDLYLKGLTQNERELLLRKTRMLKKNGVEIESIAVTENVAPAFEDFVQLHTLSWKKRGSGGYFHAFDHFKEFHSDITQQFHLQKIARLYFLKKNGTRLAAVHAFFINRTCCFYLSGLDRYHPLVKYSPGKVLLSHVIHDAIAEGYQIFDFQGGNEDYKFRLGGQLTSFSRALVWKHGSTSYKVLFFFMVQVIRRTIKDLFWDENIKPVLKKILAKKT